MKGSSVRLIIVMALLFFVSVPVTASVVPPMYQLVALEQRVPPKLFFAIALNESQSSNNNVGRALPWPWTINHRGEPHYFETREAAYRFAQRLLRAGDTQFDVGLGQINWKWHKQRFAGLWEAFDPYLNLTAAAKHLREQYERPECSSWGLATGCYHRPAQRPHDKKIASQYRKRVLKLWTKI